MVLYKYVYYYYYHSVCEQAIQMCTTSRAKKVVVSLTLIARTINNVCFRPYHIRITNNISTVVSLMVIPMSVLI